MHSYTFLSHERLDVYRSSIEFLAFATELLTTLPSGTSILGDQLRRASLSIPLNIAEGAGKMSLADSARFYVIARGSALECGALLDALSVMGKIAEPEFRRGKELLVAQVAMLTKLCRRGKT